MLKRHAVIIGGAKGNFQQEFHYVGERIFTCMGIETPRITTKNSPAIVPIWWDEDFWPRGPGGSPMT